MKATRGVDFKKLTLKDAMDLAVLVEEEARDRYAELAEQLAEHHTPAAASFFTRMARVEEVHRKTLEEKRRLKFGNEPSTIKSSVLLSVEAPARSQARAFMTVKQALLVALTSEKKAHDFFVRALDKVKDEQVKALFSSLRDEELEHQRLVNLELSRLAPDDPAPLTDEPNAV